MKTSFCRDARGSVALLFGLAFIPVILGVGVAIDYSRAASSQAHLQDIVDASALAAARSNAGNLADLKRAARAHFDAHVPPGFLAEIGDFDVTLTGDNAVRVAVAGRVETSFAAVAGLSEIGVSVAAEVMRGVRGTLEVAFVLDNTGSMSGRKLATLKEVSTQIIEDVERYGELEARFALVPFSSYVNVGTSRRGASWLDVPAETKKNRWRGCVGSRDYPLNVRDADYGSPVPALLGETCAAEIQPLTDDIATLKAAIGKMSAQGYTYIPAGLVWGWRMLSPAAPFAEGAAYDADNVEPRKIIVLLTDGKNTLAPDFPRHTVSTRTAKSDEHVLEVCNNAKAEKIEIFTIAFEVDDAAIKDVLSECASDASHYFDAEGDDALAAVFQQMAASFLELRIAK